MVSLKEARRQKGISQQALAKTCGISRTTIINYETGRRLPKISILKKICNTLGISVKDVVGDI